MAEANSRIDKAELYSFSAKVLSTMLKDRGLKCSGSKDALVNRLFEGWFNEIEDEETSDVIGTYNPHYCCVPRCHNNTQTEGVILHRFPMSQQRKSTRKLWIQKLKNVRADLKLTDNTRLCSDHFVADDYDGMKLKPESYPTIFPSKVTPLRKERLNPMDKIRASKEDRLQIYETVNATTSGMTAVDNGTDIQDVEEELSNDIMKHPEKVEVACETDIHQCIICNKCAKEIPSVKDFSCQTMLPDINIHDFQNDDKKTRFFTGFLNFGTMMLILKNLMKHANGNLNYWGRDDSLAEKDYQSGKKKSGPKRQLDYETEFLMTMMWYRLGLLQEHLSSIFKVSVSSVSRIVTTWTQFMFEHFQGFVYLPSRDQILMNMPSHFINHQNVYMVLDCTEFFIEKPSGLEAQTVTWSEYKHHCTIKCLIGVSPAGMVTYVSRAWGGRASDRHIVERGKILNLIPKGMAVMGDKGFEIEDIVPDGIDVIIPPKVSSKFQMSDYEFFKTVDIAEPRIVVEMKMEQAKNYQLLQSIIPISRIATAEQIIFNCFALTNLLPPLFQPGSVSHSDIKIPAFQSES